MFRGLGRKAGNRGLKTALYIRGPRFPPLVSNIVSLPAAETVFPSWHLAATVVGVVLLDCLSRRFSSLLLRFPQGLIKRTMALDRCASS